MSKPFDATMKRLVERFVPDYQERLRLESRKQLRTLNVDLSTVTASADIVLADGDPPRMIYHLEFQADHDKKLSRRTLLHNAVLHDRYGTPVHSVVILLRRRAAGPWVTGGVQYVTRSGLGKIEFAYEVVRLWEQPAAEFLQGGLGTLPLAPLCRLPEDVPRKHALSGVIHRVAERLKQEATPEDAAELLTATYVLTGARVKKSLMVQLFQGVLHAMHWSSGYEIILDEGRVDEARKIVLRLGRIRIGRPTKEVKAALAGINDIRRLERMSERVLTATSWEELLGTK